MKIIQKLKSATKQEKIWLLLALVILILTAARYFFALLGDYYTFLDEYPTFDAAVGFFKTGKFYKWDFHTQTLSDIQYKRAWPHTLLLTLWFHIFGVSVPAGKALSAVLGILFIFSIYFITYKIYNNYFITALSCLFLLGNESVTVIFRQIRMYSLWLLLIIWFLYFIFMILETDGYLKKKNKFTLLYNQYFSFSVEYIIVAALLLIFCYATHINTLVTGAGIFLFFLYLLFTKKENKYITAFIIFLLLSILGIGLYSLCARGIRIPVIFNLYLVLISDTFIGQYDPQNIRYFYWVRDYMGSPALMGISFICVLIAFVKNIRKRNKKFDFSLYAMLILVSSLLCFIYLFSRYYQDRYMIYAAPLISIVAAWGIVESTQLIKSRNIKRVVYFALIISVAVQMGINFKDIYYSTDICYHKEVYDKIQKDAEETPIAIAGYDFRDYYAVQEIADYVTAPFDRKQDMEILYDFARKYPQGYVVVETAKIYGITDSVRVFMQNYAERIAGDGIDQCNIDVCRYHFLYPEKVQKGMYKKNEMECGCVKFSFDAQAQKTEIRISVDTSKLMPTTKIVFLNFGIFTTEKESLPMCFQLVLPEEMPQKNIEYSAVIDKECAAVELKEDCEVYYTDKTYKEMKLWEK